MLPCLASSSAEGRWKACDQHFDRTFSIEWGRFAFSSEVRLEEGGSIWVLPHMLLGKDRQVCTHSARVALSDFLSGAPPTKSTRTPQAAQDKPKAQASEDVMAQHPWLADFMDAPKKPGSASSSSKKTPVSTAVVADIDEDECHKIRQTLEAKRAEWHEEYSPVAEDFVCDITGGPWAKKNLGVEYDGVRAHARGGAPADFCRRWGLAMSSSFAFKSLEEYDASMLAQAWCHRMQYFFDCASSAPERGFTFTDAIVEAYQEDPQFATFVADLAPHSLVRPKALQIRKLRPALRPRA